MQSHSNMVPECRFGCKRTFAGGFQLSEAPQGHDNVMVLTVWSNECQKAGYLPLQYLMPMEKREVDAEFQALAQRKQITRVEGYAELRAMSNALAVIGKELSIFEIPNTVMHRELKYFEVRELREDGFWISNTAIGEECKQIPDHWSFKTQHCLVSLSDQGGLNREVLDYCQCVLPQHCLYPMMGNIDVTMI